MKYIGISAIIITMIIALYLIAKVYSYTNVDSGLKIKITKGAIILDVRTKGEFSEGNIKNSKNISLGEIRERHIELDSSKIYITTCSHGLRSIKAEKILKQYGYKHVYNGGAWVDLEKIIDND